MDKKQFYEELLSQLSPQNKGYAPDYERFSNQSMTVQAVLPSRIINTKITDYGSHQQAHNSMLTLEEAAKHLEDIVKEKDKTPLSFELPTSDAIVMDIYKQFTCKDEYRNLFLEFSNKFGCLARITLGLIEDAMVDEMETIDFLASNQPKGIIFSVFIPENSEESKKQQLMPIERAAAVFMYAHKKMPNCQLILSSVHPDGNYGKELEILAFMHGVKHKEVSC